MQDRFYKFYLHPDFIYKWTKKYKREKELYDFCYFISRRVMDIYKKKRGSKKRTVGIDDEVKMPQSFIEQLYELKDRGLFSDMDIKDELDTLILAVCNL